jgi:hypothetical protein
LIDRQRLAGRRWQPVPGPRTVTSLSPTAVTGVAPISIIYVWLDCFYAGGLQWNWLLSGFRFHPSCTHLHHKGMFTHLDAPLYQTLSPSLSNPLSLSIKPSFPLHQTAFLPGAGCDTMGHSVWGVVRGAVRGREGDAISTSVLIRPYIPYVPSVDGAGNPPGAPSCNHRGCCTERPATSPEGRGCRTEVAARGYSNVGLAGVAARETNAVSLPQGKVAAHSVCAWQEKGVRTLRSAVRKSGCK